jgi:hypothetical protein
MCIAIKHNKPLRTCIFSAMVCLLLLPVSNLASSQDHSNGITGDSTIVGFSIVLFHGRYDQLGEESDQLSTESFCEYAAHVYQPVCTALPMCMACGKKQSNA